METPENEIRQPISGLLRFLQQANNLLCIKEALAWCDALDLVGVSPWVGFKMTTLHSVVEDGVQGVDLTLYGRSFGI